MNVYDTDLIMSWTPREFKLRMQAAQLREVDETERVLIAAILSGNVARSKERVSIQKVYNAKAIRSRILGEDAPEKKKSYVRFEKAVQAVNNFNFKFTPKEKKEG